MKYYLVISATSSSEEAEDIGGEIVRSRLAACANVIEKIKSVYWWEGNIEKSGEALLLAKTNEDCLDDLISKVKKLHSYDVPEVIALPIKKGSEDYLEWLNRNVKKDS